MVQLMLVCPSRSFAVTISTPSHVSREAKVCRNMCHVAMPSPARFTAARSAPFTSLNFSQTVARITSRSGSFKAKQNAGDVFAGFVGSHENRVGS